VAGRPPKTPLTAAQILAWADEHRGRTGAWPTLTSGPVAGAAGQETWQRLDNALRQGVRGLPGGDSLARLLRRERGMPERRGRAKLNPRRRRRAAELRAAGLTLAQIGKRLGVSAQAIHELLRKAGQEGTRP
jgi:hypothetical protein